MNCLPSFLEVPYPKNNLNSKCTEISVFTYYVIDSLSQFILVCQT